jgi:hypothetical protein
MVKRGLALKLKPYGIHPHNVRIAGKPLKGYEAKDFEDAWRRYCVTEDA